MVYGHEDFVQWGPLEQGDIADKDKLVSVIKQYKPHAVMHFAAYAYVGESVINPGKYYRNNVAGTLTLLEVMRDFDVKNIVFSSTCATYGVPQQIPMQETHVQNPINPYGRSKLFIEEILKDFDKAHDIKNVCLRYFNAAGADPDCMVGEDHNPETHLIPLVLDVALGKRPSISVFGNDYETSDGTCIRDYIHVSDLADAHLLALQYLDNNRKSEAFNLGNGKGFSVYDVIKTAEKVTEKTIKIKEVKRREGDPAALVGSATKAFEQLQWQPKYSELETIMEHAWQWHKKRFG